ncbi:type II secretion system protein [Candidatus Kaiserbacteria bacterium]|nr:type II secretion system protein [Candidatus Kaiserbacteria bacterium]
MNFRSQKLGFTLVELLIVVAIMGILGSILYLSFPNIRAESRDLERQSDLRALQIAIELYKKKHGRYPEGCRGANNWSGDPASSYACSGDQPYILGLAPEFIPVLPYDPKLNGANSGYVYVTNADGSVYKLMAMRTVEAEKVHYCHEMASCDIKPTSYSTGADISEFSDCADGPGNQTSRAPGSTDISQYGWCIAKPSDLNMYHCKMSSSPFAQGGDGRFETSYAVWGGYHEDTVEPTGSTLSAKYSKINDTADIICK